MRGGVGVGGVIRNTLADQVDVVGVVGADARREEAPREGGGGVGGKIDDEAVVRGGDGVGGDLEEQAADRVVCPALGHLRGQGLVHAGGLDRAVTGGPGEEGNRRHGNQHDEAEGDDERHAGAGTSDRQLPIGDRRSVIGASGSRIENLFHDGEATA